MRRTFTTVIFSLLILTIPTAQAKPDEMSWVTVAQDKKGFVLDPSGRLFVPWGFNYDHDDRGRLIEDYWEAEWPTVEAHFGQMKKLGANVVRVHLQLGKFMDGPEKPNGKALDRLGKLLKLAERLRLYLDLTGLGCYHKKDVPMNLGCLVTLANHPADVFLVVIDNGVYEVTGGQPTPGAGRTAFPGLARAAGIRRVYDCHTLDEWRAVAAEALAGPGPVVICLAVEARPGQKAPAAMRPIRRRPGRRCPGAAFAYRGCPAGSVPAGWVDSPDWSYRVPKCP